MGYDTFVMSNISISIEDLKKIEGTAQTNIDVVRILYDHIFSSEDSMKDKNKFLMLYLQHYITADDTNLINRVLSDTAITDLHPSLLKSMLIMTENVNGVNREKVIQLLADKMQ